MQLLGLAEQKDLEIQLEFTIGHSYDSTQRKVMGGNEDNKENMF